jgi:hypothetical protein
VYPSLRRDALGRYILPHHVDVPFSYRLIFLFLWYSKMLKQRTPAVKGKNQSTDINDEV